MSLFELTIESAETLVLDDVASVSPIRTTLQAEVPSVTIVLDNGDGRAVERLGIRPPLGRPATLRLRDEIVFVGRVVSINLGAEARVTLEA